MRFRTEIDYGDTIAWYREYHLAARSRSRSASKHSKDQGDEMLIVHIQFRSGRLEVVDEIGKSRVSPVQNLHRLREINGILARLPQQPRRLRPRASMFVLAAG